MEALLDVDLLYKLARFDLLADFNGALIARGFLPPHGRVPSAPWSMKTHKKPLPASLWPDVTQASTFRDFCLQRCRSATGIEAANLASLAVPGFDAGEIALIARAIEVPTAFVFTGDKRAIQVVATNGQLVAPNAALAGRFVHLDMVMERLSESLGWSHVAALVVTSGVDIGLQRIYQKPSEQEMARAMASSIAGLRSRTGGLLAATF